MKLFLFLNSIIVQAPLEGTTSGTHHSARALQALKIH